MQSVIVSTYNKPQHLRLVLEGLRWQETDEYEVIVADDGSGPETARLVEEFGREVSFPVQHVWQEDDGFRAARIRNLGVAASKGDQLVFLDGDCIPFRDFLAAHARAEKPGRLLAGDRLFLDEKPSAALTVEDLAGNRLDEIVPAEEKRRLRWRATKNVFYRWTRLKKRPKVVTANLSMPRRAFEAVNGLDERFVGWGHEDEDLRRRLVRRGYRVESVLNTARVCHLWHRQVASFRGKVKYGDNVEYYQRGFYLSRCREGLTHRPISECRLAWNGEADPGKDPVEISVGWGSHPTWCDSEVRVFVQGQTPSGISLPVWDLTLVPPDVSPPPGVEPPRRQPNVVPGEIRLPDSRPLDLTTAEGRATVMDVLSPVL